MAQLLHWMASRNGAAIGTATGKVKQPQTVQKASSASTTPVNVDYAASAVLPPKTREYSSPQGDSKSAKDKTQQAAGTSVPSPTTQSAPQIRPKAASQNGVNAESQSNVGCGSHGFSMHLSSQGSPIEQGGNYSSNDPRFARGRNLILAVDYMGVEPKRTTLAIEWYVNEKPVSFFPVVAASSCSGSFLRAYDNEIVEPGEHTIILKVNGQEMSQSQFSFRIISQHAAVPPNYP
jgi:hypothetical protein